MAEDRLLLVGAGLMGEGYVRAAGELGLRVGLVERPRWFTRYRDRVAELFECAASTDQHWAAATDAAVRAWRPDHVVGFAEPQVLAAAIAQDALGLPGPSLRAAVASRDKGLQRTLAQAHGIPQPEFVLARDVEEAREFADPRYPVVVKTLRSSGSRGVFLVADAAELKDAMARCGRNDPVLVESFVDGPEYSCELLVHRQEILFANYTRKITTGAPEFVELGHVLPVSLGADQPAVDRVVADLVAALGVHTSLVHTEFRLSGGLPYVMETAVRTPGDHIMELLSLAYDRDMFAQVINLHRGDVAAVPGEAAGPFAIRYLQPEPGRFLRVDAPADIPGLVRMELPYRQDEMITPLTSSGDRGGYAILGGSDEAELVERMADLAASVKVVTV